MTQKLDEITYQLNKKLHDRYKNDTELFSKLTKVQINLGLLFGDRLICPFLRPHFLSRTQYEKISHAAEVIAAAAECLTKAALENEELLSEFDLTEREKRLVRVDPGYERLCPSSRFDTFIAGNDFTFLEYNAETPAGVGDQKPLERFLESVPVNRDFLEKIRHWRPNPQHALLKTLLQIYREFGGKKSKPNIAIVDWDNVSTKSEFHVLKSYFESMSFRTLVADPSKLEYDRNNLHVGNFEIDILYKRVLIHEFLEKYDDTHPLWNAYVDGNICMANSFRVKIAHKKASFAIMTNEKYASLFTPKQLDAIAKHVPWTRKVKESRTQFKGSEIDLLRFLRVNKEQFLLKPNDDYGGEGIVVGWESSQKVWDDAIDKALRSSFVVQEKAPIEKKMFPVFSDSVKLEYLFVDFDPFLFQNKVEGGMVRLSSSSLANVTQGGGQTALIVLEDF